MWHHLFLSHQQVQGIFGLAPPTLDRVFVRELLFKIGSPANVYFSAYVECASERYPKAWLAKGFDSLQFRFAASLLVPPKIVGLPVSSSAVSIAFRAGHFCLTALDGSWSVEGEAILERVHAEPFQDPGPGHDHDWFRP